MRCVWLLFALVVSLLTVYGAAQLQEEEEEGDGELEEVVSPSLRRLEDEEGDDQAEEVVNPTLRRLEDEEGDDDLEEVVSPSLRRLEDEEGDGQTEEVLDPDLRRRRPRPGRRPRPNGRRRPRPRPNGWWRSRPRPRPRPRPWWGRPRPRPSWPPWLPDWLRPWWLSCYGPQTGVVPPRPTTPRIPVTRDIVGTCRADLGRCPVSACRYDSRRPVHCRMDGYTCPVYETITVTCPQGNQQARKVKECTCCKDDGIKITVRVTSDGVTALAGKTVSIGGGIATGSTDANGEFTTTIPSWVRKVIATITDPSKAFASSIKVEDIPIGTRGPVVVLVVLVKKASPVSFDAGTAKTLSISSNPSDGTAGRAKIIFAGGTFTKNGVPHTGTVNAKLTFIDTSSQSAAVDAQIPGRLETPSGMELTSDGMFQLEVTDPADNNSILKAGKVKIQVASDMKLWKQDANGAWMETGTPVTGRKKRQVTFSEIEADIDDARWFNMDKIPNTPNCYFKARVFDQGNGVEITGIADASFKVKVLTLEKGPPLRRMGSYFPPTNEPDSTCYRVRCTTPTTKLFGLMNMKSYKDTDLGGTMVNVVTQLSPRPLADYSPAITTAHTALAYEIVNSGVDIFTNHIIPSAGPPGPYYSTEAQCKASTVAQPAFHFFAPPSLPYIQAPAGTKFCDARIGFFDGKQSTGFISLVDGLANPVKVTSLSTWTAGGENYFFTGTIFMKKSTDGSFYVACIKYRCSEASSITTVSINVDIPNKTIDGAQTPMFKCFTGSTGGRRRRDTTSTALGTITPPTSATLNGPDYYSNPDSNDCESKAAADKFAARFSCIKDQTCTAVNQARCAQVANAECIDNLCKCNAGFFGAPDATTCVPAIGMPCSAANAGICNTIPNAICEADVCVCQPGFSIGVGGTACVS